MQKRKRQKAYRAKNGDKWLAVIVHEYQKNRWNVGAVIHKSKRAQNDWYNYRRNRRSRSVDNCAKKHSIKDLMIMFRLLKQAIKERRDTDWFTVYSDNLDAKGWSYIERLGFKAHHSGNQLLWVLKARQAEEASNLAEYTMQTIYQRLVREIELAYEPYLESLTYLASEASQQDS